MDRRRCIEAEHRHRRGHFKQMDHPTAITQEQLDNDSQVSFPWENRGESVT